MSAGANLLAFLGLVVTLLIVWRQSWPARLRLFVAQSLLLAVLAGTIGVLAARPGLLLVAAVFVVVKGWVIPRVLARIGAGASPSGRAGQHGLRSRHGLGREAGLPKNRQRL